MKEYFKIVPFKIFSLSYLQSIQTLNRIKIRFLTNAKVVEMRIGQERLHYGYYEGNQLELKDSSLFQRKKPVTIITPK